MITRFKIGLRPRLLLAMLTLVLVVLSGFVYALSSFFDALEDDMIHGELTRDMDRVAALYARDPTLLDVQEAGLKIYAVPRGETGSLPQPLLHLADGEAHEVGVPGSEYEVGAARRDVGDKSLYLLLDLTPVEKLQRELIGAAWISGLAALCLAVIVGLWLSQLVMRPVRGLARRVSEVVPGQPRATLHTGTGDRQLDVIVAAFEGVLDRFDAFVAREQAFTEDASHELRTPLATVISSLDLMSGDSTLSAKTRTRLMRARAAAARMHELIESLLLFAREEDGDCAPAAVSPVVREAIALQEELFSGGEAERAHITFDARAECTVNAPSSMLLTVISNLLRNAIEHGGPGEIEVVLDAHSLVVSDQGEGVAPAALSRLFDRRFRGHHSAGQGIGLYLVKRISERYGWQVQVQSTPGQGTRFELRFHDVMPQPARR